MFGSGVLGTLAKPCVRIGLLALGIAFASTSICGCSGDSSGGDKRLVDLNPQPGEPDDVSGPGASSFSTETQTPAGTGGGPSTSNTGSKSAAVQRDSKSSARATALKTIPPTLPDDGAAGSSGE